MILEASVFSMFLAMGVLSGITFFAGRFLDKKIVDRMNADNGLVNVDLA